MNSIVLNASLDRTRSDCNQFSDRVIALLSNRGCTKAWLSKELGISKQSLNYVLKNNKYPKFVSEIALIFDVNPKWLETGEGPIYLTYRSEINNIPLFNLSDVLENNSINNLKMIDKILFNNATGYKHFALLFNSCPSMSSKFKENSILIFAQDKMPLNGSYVIANIHGKNYTFRQYFKEKETIILKSLDEDFGSMSCNACEIMGTLIETRIKF